MLCSEQPAFTIDDLFLNPEKCVLLTTSNLDIRENCDPMDGSRTNTETRRAKLWYDDDVHEVEIFDLIQMWLNFHGNKGLHGPLEHL